ncbi:WD repeat-containing protein 43 [Chelonus insularis]|uniref:WD repeat-containing protein 43 n=1 Tax=Chelonus insularis TaxID=460826 RepID=UPI00158C5F51|nr:WD repeat-containing protein 43 [Chelonus insularis]
MADSGYHAFSPDGKYWAHCGRVGKLHIWETSTSKLKQEFIPNLHLSSPCSVLEWISVVQQASTTTPSPWKKRRRKSIVEDSEQKQIVAMGSINGKITLYDVASASVNKVLESNQSAAITAMTWSASSGLFSAGADNQIIEWNIQENGIKCKWKSGTNKITALAVLPDGNSIISAERLITWWDLETKNVIATYTGHANPIVLFRTVRLDNNTSYLISGANGDNYLNVWSLSKNATNKTAVATLTLQDDPVSLSVKMKENSQLSILTTNRLGQCHFFSYQLNGISLKPLKPTLTVVIASDSKEKDTIPQIPIQSAHLTEDDKFLIAYGSRLSLTFEKITPDFSDKFLGLVRSEIKWTKEKKEEAVAKVKSIETEGNVEYLATGSTSISTKRPKGGGSQLPLQNRLENLSLNVETNLPGQTPLKGANMAQLLFQGLMSKDTKILTEVLYIKREEKLIKNTILKLPVQAITPLLQELTTMLQGKTYPSKIAVIWLKNLIIIHTAHLLSLPNIGELLSPILGLIDAKLGILSELSRLRGRVALVTGQISHLNEKQNDDITNDCLLTYQDPDSSEEEADAQGMEEESESGESWEEMSDQDENLQMLQNGRSDDEDNDDDNASIGS